MTTTFKPYILTKIQHFKRDFRNLFFFEFSLFILLFSTTNIHSQTPDTLTIIRNDTTIQFVQPNTRETPLQGKTIEDILKNYSNRNIFSRKLHEWLVKSSIEESESSSGSAQKEFIDYKGKTISHIDVRHIQPFGGSVEDTVSVADSWIARLGNKLRFETASGVILKTITFSEGQSVSTTDITDSERLLRSFSFINDVRIIIWPHPENPESVNVSIYVQDRYPHAISLGLTDQNPSFTLINKNLFGRGFSLSHTLVTPTIDISTWGFRETFGAENIFGEYLDFEIDYSHIENLEMISGILKKDFVLPEIKYAGEISINRSFISPKIFEYPAMEWEPPLDYLRKNFYIGRSFLLNNPDSPLRSNIYILGRHLDIELFDTPPASPLFSGGKFYYGGLAFSRRGYYKNNLIYSFGRTEDVPHGMLAGLSYGYHEATDTARHFLALHYSSGRALIPSKGYLYLSGDIGSFFQKGNPEQGYLKLSGEYITPLINVGQSKMRSFLELQYVTGLHRKQGEYLSIDEDVNGLHRFEYRNTIRGLEKAVLKTEQVFFTPMEPLGFKFAFFTFFDTAFLRENEDHGLFSHTPYFSFGGGLRIRNDNLVFNTLQIRLSIMPRVPEGELPFSFRTSGESVKNFRDFVPEQPGNPVFY
ncbi:hypothetical protein [Marinilabilia salmonicolor]|uniref:hypothetical protein n=1 Tax=Marinilabilia salmonicolor TaxID=989 RepID=UPI000299D5C9|nr:hypothetical protein [Marinilabilia salmonicolor]